MRAPPTLRISAAVSAVLVLIVLGGCRLRELKSPAQAGESTVDMVPQVHAARGQSSAAALSSDGAYAAVGTEEGRVIVFNVNTNNILRFSDIHSAEVTAVAFRNHDSELLSVAQDGRLCVHDLTRSGLPLCRQRDPFDFYSASFSADGRHVASGRAARIEEDLADKTRVDVIEVDTGKIKGSMRGIKRATFSVTLAGNAERVAAYGQSAKRRSFVKGVRGGPRKKTLRGLGGALAFALNADGTRLVTATAGQLTTYDTNTGAVLQQISDPGLEHYVGELSLSPDGRYAILLPQDTLRTYDLVKGEVLGSTPPVTSGATAMAFSGDGKRVIVGGWSGTIGLFDFSEDGSLAPRPLNFYRSRVTTAHFAPEGTKAFIGADEGLYELDLRLGGLRRLLYDTREVTAVSPDGRSSATWAREGEQDQARLWTPQPGAPPYINELSYLMNARVLGFDGSGRRIVDRNGTVYELTDADPRSLMSASGSDLSTAELSWSGALLATGGRDPEGLPRTFEESAHVAKIYDVASGRRLATFHHPEATSAVTISRDDRLLATGEAHYWLNSNNERALNLPFKVRVWDIASGRELLTIDGPQDGAGALAFASDKSFLLVGGANAYRVRRSSLERGSALHMYDLHTGKRLKTMPGHVDAVLSISISPDNKLALTTSKDGTARLFNLETGESAAIVAVAGEWLIYTPDGYFAASRTGHVLVSAVEGKRVFGIDQLAPRNNRPDVIMTRLKFGLPEVIEHYKARYERRLEKLGLSEDRLSASLEQAPVAAIEKVEVNGADAVVKFTLEDKGTSLLRYNVYVNNVPLHGPGKPVEGRSQRLTETVELLQGPNRIEVSVINQAGVESLRAFRVVEGPERPKGDLYFLGFGVSEYSDRRLNLRFAHQDALDLGATLGGRQGSDAFANVHVRTYINEEVTVARIREAKSFLRPARAIDTVILFVAGHGTHTRDAAADYYYITHETDVNRLTETAADFERIESLLQGIAPRQKLFLLDTCESGEADEDAPVIAELAGQRGLHARTTRALELDPGTPAKTGAPAPKRAVLHIDRERYIYNDLARRTGAIVLSSSRGSELSYEKGELQNGVFTEALIEALSSSVADANNDGIADTLEIREYVGRRVAELTNDLQHPTVDRDNREVLIRLPRFEPGVPTPTTTTVEEQP